MKNILFLSSLLELTACGSKPEPSQTPAANTVDFCDDATLRMDCEQQVNTTAYVIASVLPDLRCGDNGITYNVKPGEFLGNARYEGDEAVNNTLATDSNKIHIEAINCLNEEQAADIEVSCAQNGQFGDGLDDLAEDLCTREWQVPQVDSL